MTKQKLIVVGIDGSDAAIVALRWACGEAISTGAAIEAVHAYLPAAGPSPAAGGARAQSSSLLSREVWVALAAIKDSPPIRLSNQPGDPAAVLISRSARAGLLVLGATEPNAGDATRAGSIVAICRQDARCPVSVIDPGSPAVARTLSNASQKHGRIPQIPTPRQPAAAGGGGGMQQPAAVEPLVPGANEKVRCS
ncbi:nucleotide-binding universal stress UspA family protein [Nakamurella sp. UYEF19]|uniref:universal stress protein n=1 Tax=Nakamurella sp. UYEF19 TaxID=1756392 RepID=UPI0033996C5E